MALQPINNAKPFPVTPAAPQPAPVLAGGRARVAVAGDRLALAATPERTLTPADRQLLDDITATHVQYFIKNSDPVTGLTLDRSAPGSAASIAALGFSLTAHGVAVHRNLMSRAEGAAYTLKSLRALLNAPQAQHHGFFYHFLEPKSVKRAGDSELSTVDTALLMGGVLFARNFYDGNTPDEQAIRKLSTQLYNQVDWRWALDGGDTLTLGWKPEKSVLSNLVDAWHVLSHPFQQHEGGFLLQRWQGYNEGMLMVLLGMGSPTHPLPPNAWQAYHQSDAQKDSTAGKYVPFGPQFGHQYTEAWVDFRGIQDDASRARGFDWAENSRRATLAQIDYAKQNPQGFRGYGALDWGLTASDGPGDRKVEVDGKTRQLHGYLARGINGSPDDGTLAPTAVAGSLPFAPAQVLDTLHHWREQRPELWGDQGFADAFNPSADPSKPSGWVDTDRLGIDQGPIVLMTENYRSDFVWDVMKRDPDLRRGLQRAGFRGGWLDT